MKTKPTYQRTLTAVFALIAAKQVKVKVTRKPRPANSIKESFSIADNYWQLLSKQPKPQREHEHYV